MTSTTLTETEAIEIPAAEMSALLANLEDQFLQAQGEARYDLWEAERSEAEYAEHLDRLEWERGYGCGVRE